MKEYIPSKGRQERHDLARLRESRDPVLLGESDEVLCLRGVRPLGMEMGRYDENVSRGQLSLSMMDADSLKCRLPFENPFARENRVKHSRTSHRSSYKVC